MPVHRKRFRIEESFFGAAPVSAEADEDLIPMQREIMNELRAIREQMAGPTRGAAAESGNDPTVRQASEAQLLLQTYRAQIEQCEKLKIELDLIHDAISRTKHEIAVLHGKSFNGGEMSRVTGELGAVVGGILLGVTITLLGRYVGFIGSTLKLPTALMLILVLLLVRPGGLFGRVAVRRV